jgi:hypothetical protein
LNPDDFKLIINAIKSGKCLAFLGAGACTPFLDKEGKEVPGLPTGSELAKWLAERCEYTNGSTYDLAKVAEFFLYQQGGDREALQQAIQEKLLISCCARPIHTILSQLNEIKVMITSNYDNLLENELQHYNRILTKHIYDPENPRTAHFQKYPILGEREAVLHKMHGSVESPWSMVITTSDYIHFLATLTDADRGMPEFFRKTMISQSKLLFLGYSLNDWNFQVIWEGVLSNYISNHTIKEAYALVKTPSPFLIRYWQRRNVIVIDEDLTLFATQLAKEFNLEIPQLGIAKKPEGGTHE